MPLQFVLKPYGFLKGVRHHFHNGPIFGQNSTVEIGESSNAFLNNFVRMPNGDFHLDDPRFRSIKFMNDLITGSKDNSTEDTSSFTVKEIEIFQLSHL